MARLLWDQTGERVFETGVDHGVLYTERNTSSSIIAFSKATVWNGLSSVSESPEGAEPNDIWADNMKYGTLRSAETYKTTIEAYTYPDEFAECDGSAEPIPGVRIGQQERKMFGFSYQTDVGDDTDNTVDPENKYKLHIVWNCTASPSEKQYQTINDSPEAITFSWEVETTPIKMAGYKPTSTMSIDVSKLDATGLTNFEVLLGVLYGTSDKDGYLPDPATVINIMRTGTAPTIPNE